MYACVWVVCVWVVCVCFHYCTLLFSVAPPLFVIEFLHRVVDVLTDYLGECTEIKIKDHYVIVYEVSRGWEGPLHHSV